ncbi:hypothetical protein J2Z62_000116 [Mycoplasmoides fastidiosum]|uniref:Transposase n=1 Tax=Mycoplasmoides fastidiosum TaxID=92758 RepID=A0ABU0LYB7_9BACT|nr:hypothetical protein [Mycoplasmoides fastidiosum]MDQ0513678.1 hypothetical protein [Mycoplasmoides fastidiosum]UUD37903.1 hypothetical protein NPA10_00705 [Mycoplasmoides fastidiosum]
MNELKKKKTTVFTIYKPGLSTTKKAKRILDDLLNDLHKPRICRTCHSREFIYNQAQEHFICHNAECAQPTILYLPAYGWKLNYAKLELFLALIIDTQQIEMIQANLKMSKQVARKWHNRFIDQINWKKYKLSKDLLDVREVYASISWQQY